MAETKVRNKSNTKEGIYIGRGSVFGNPWSSKKSKYDTIVVSSDKEAIANYKLWVTGEGFLDFRQKELFVLTKSLKHLKNETLLCYCYPGVCHGDVLVELVNKLK